MMKNSIPQGYRIVELPKEEFFKKWEEWGPQIFSDNDTSLNLKLLLSDIEKMNLKKLAQNLEQMQMFNLCIFFGDEFCGWFTGDQYNNETFYMRNSAILPEHRRKGLYTALMHEVISRVKGYGYQKILSRHVITNNSIIIPKLKAGFTISAMELSDRFGTLVHLTYYFNETRQEIVKFRAGDLKPDHRIKEVLGIN